LWPVPPHFLCAGYPPATIFEMFAKYRRTLAGKTVPYSNAFSWTECILCELD
jgi:hypothetical protein